MALRSVSRSDLCLLICSRGDRIYMSYSEGKCGQRAMIQEVCPQGREERSEMHLGWGRKTQIVEEKSPGQVG